jgi:hypothetical protein
MSQPAKWGLRANFAALASSAGDLTAPLYGGLSLVAGLGESWPLCTIFAPIPDVLCQSLQFRSRDLFIGEHYFNEYGRIVAPVNADMIINPLHQGIALILRLQTIDAVRNFFGALD